MRLFLFLAGSLAIGFHAFAGERNNRIEMAMTDEKKIAREWVEIREDSKDGSLVFRPIDYPVAPARGRRHLQLLQAGEGSALEPGPTDRLQSSDKGNWSIDKQILRMNISGWEGDYNIEELQDNILILRKR